MFWKKTPEQVTELNTPNTIIGKGVYLEAARLTGQESIRIEGVFKGTIDLDGSLMLGDGGTIIGDVRAKYFLVAGSITGNIECAQLHFASTAKVEGDIRAGSLIVDEGSQVTGRYTIGRGNTQALQDYSTDTNHITQDGDY